jgi:hypothetical protein
MMGLEIHPRVTALDVACGKEAFFVEVHADLLISWVRFYPGDEIIVSAS